MEVGRRNQENHLRGLFGFLGITDITFVRAEGVNMGPEVRTRSIETAKGEIFAMVA